MNKADLKRIMEADFIRCMKTKFSREEHCPIKTCMNLTREDGVSIERFTVLPANDGEGNFGTKCIYVNDKTNEYKETYVLNASDVFDYTGMTKVRCAVMNSIVLDLMDLPKKPKVGFVGNGRVNLETAKWIDASEFVIHGRKGNEGKNFEEFNKIRPTVVDRDFSELNDCDVVFVCTNSYLKEDLTSNNELKCKRLVVLDCGYTLDESFRTNYKLFSDYPEQLILHWKDEFPFDKVPHQFFPMTSNGLKSDGNIAVYLHGCGISDLSLAKVMKGIK